MPETAERLTINQAYESAKATLAAEPGSAPEKTVEEPVKSETKAQEQSETQAEVTEKAPDQPTESAESDELLSKEDQAKLTVEQQKAYKAMQKAYTQKTQKLAARAKELEQWDEVIKAFEADPKETLMRLAKVYDVPLAQTTQETKTAEATTTAAQGAVLKLREFFGPENAQVADALAPIIQDLAKEVAETVVQSQVKPIVEKQELATKKALASEAEADLKAFSVRHPDWKDYEGKIVELSMKFQPAQGSNVEPSEYLDMLYAMATRNKSAAASTADVVARINKAAQAAEKPEAGVREQVVQPAAPKRPTIQEAFEAAKKGIRWG